MTTIITNYSLTPDAVPASTDLAVGELGVNAADGTLFTSSDGTDVVPVRGSLWKAGTIADTIQNANTGFVGVGIEDPDQQLTVGGIIKNRVTGQIANYIAHREDAIILDDTVSRWASHGLSDVLGEVVGGRIDYVAEGPYTASATPTRIAFYNGRTSSSIVEAMRIDSDGTILMGLSDQGSYTTLSTNTTLAVANGAITDRQPLSTANEFVISSATNAGMSIITEDTGTGRVVFGSLSEQQDAVISWNNATKEMHFGGLNGATMCEMWNGPTPGDNKLLVGASISPPNSGWEFQETGFGYGAVDSAGATQVAHLNIHNGAVFQGGITSTSTRVYYNTTSDYRLKENVVPLINGLDRLMELQPKQFNFIRASGHTVDGFIAHEVAEVVPDAVGGEKDGDDMQTLDNSVLIPVLVAAVQELKAQVEALS